MKYKIYTDGACKGNPGPGGWGFVIIDINTKKEIRKSGKSKDTTTTNNKMEMIAVIKALESIPRKSKVTLYSDSKYVIDGITSWIHNWKKNNWITSTKSPVKNAELWKKLDKLNIEHHIKWEWVKAHSGNKYNELADSLANSKL